MFFFSSQISPVSLVVGGGLVSDVIGNIQCFQVQKGIFTEIPRDFFLSWFFLETKSCDLTPALTPIHPSHRDASLHKKQREIFLLPDIFSFFMFYDRQVAF